MKTKKKWYDDVQLVGSLLFFVPPVGIYGVYKSQSIPHLWKNVTYVSVLVACMAFLVIYLS